MQQKYATRFNTSYNAGYASPPADTIRAAEIAALLNMKLQTFQKRRAQLIALGMPRAVPGGVWVWSRAAIKAWIEGSGQAQALSRPGAARDPVEVARDAMEARMGAGRS